ncbi:hypothetical protein LCGC14_1965130, partial [marine sediment metagenome]
MQMRSVQEIVDRLNLKKEHDMFGTYLDLIEFLPAPEASYFLKPDT